MHDDYTYFSALCTCMTQGVPGEKGGEGATGMPGRMECLEKRSDRKNRSQCSRSLIGVDLISLYDACRDSKERKE